MKKLLFTSLVILIAAAASVFAQGEASPGKAPQSRHGKFEIRQTERGKFSFVLKASNGKEILSGFFYSSADKVKGVIEKVKTLVSDDANFDIRNEKQQWYFFLKGEDGKAVAQSEHYTAEAAMRKGIESVKKTAPDADLNEP